MYLKIQNRGIAGDLNNGSCAAYAFYLGHENRWKKDNGMRGESIPFFDSNGNEVSVDTVISSIDSNKKGLHIEDVKYYSLVINPSKKEAGKFGVKREEKLKAIQKMVDEMMDRYAVGFGKEEIKSHNDLRYYYTIHEYREDENGQQKQGLHVHIIISRKDNGGKHKLSPMTNHRGETTGIIKSGFNRDSFYRDCEIIFDKAFAYERRIAESYDYLNALEHGTDKEKSAMIRAAVQEEGIRAAITRSLSKRAARLAEEAAAAEAKRQRESELARKNEDKKKQNEFWNNYNSYYGPTLDRLNCQCKSAFSLYSELKAEHADINEDISEQYQHLKRTYELISNKRSELEKARNLEEFVKSFAFLMTIVNPIPILILSFVLILFLEGKKLDNKANIQALRHKADQIRTNIDYLKDEQERLKLAQNDTLRQYIQVKDEKTELKNKLNELKRELNKPQETSIDLESLAKELAERKAAPQKDSFGVVLDALGVYGAVMAAETKQELDLELLTDNTYIEPVNHPNGGVADFKITKSGTELLASKTYSNDKLAAMLEKWSVLTGQKPAYKIASTAYSEKSIAINPNTEISWTTKNSSTLSSKSQRLSKQQKPSNSQQKKQSQFSPKL